MEYDAGKFKVCDVKCFMECEFKKQKTKELGKIENGKLQVPFFIGSLIRR